MAGIASVLGESPRRSTPRANDRLADGLVLLRMCPYYFGEFSLGFLVLGYVGTGASQSSSTKSEILSVVPTVVYGLIPVV